MYQPKKVWFWCAVCGEIVDTELSFKSEDVKCPCCGEWNVVKYDGHEVKEVTVA